ncbi:MAG: membrane dipeptidase [Anaerolineae bacterium]|nr:membrane dipeptidase [Anaerolineae bacterium]
MLIIDAHLDLAWNALQWNRDLTSAVYTIRAQEADVPGKGRGQNTVALPDLRRGRVALCFATVLARSTGRPAPNVDFRSPAQAYGVAQGQLAYYRGLEQGGFARVITNTAQLDAHIGEWQAWDAAEIPGEAPPLGIVISMESADPVLDPAQLEAWWAAGLRLIGPAHYGMGRYAGGTSVEDGFTETGLALLARMQSLGFALDLTHLSDRAFWQALDHFDGAVLASHNNCRALVPHQRQYDDRQIKAIAERGGVIGAAFDTWMLQPGWIKGVSTNERVTLANVVDHIDHVCQITGGSDTAAIGTDLDGGYGREQSPCDLDTIADLQRIPEILAQRGYAETDIARIMHGNWLRLLRRAWGGHA